MLKRYDSSWTMRAMVLIGLTFILEACGGGVPIRLRVDQFAVDVDLGDAIDNVESSLLAQGILPEGSRGIPAIWPSDLPRVQYDVDLTSPPVPVDLTPEPGGDNEDAYQAINQAGQIINRLEINRLVLRLERSDVSIPVPELQVQVADTLDADPNDRLAWFTIGRIEGSDGEDGGPKDLSSSLLKAVNRISTVKWVMRIVSFLCAFVAKPRSIPTSSLKSLVAYCGYVLSRRPPSSSILRVRHPLVLKSLRMQAPAVMTPQPIAVLSLPYFRGSVPGYIVP